MLVCFLSYSGCSQLHIKWPDQVVLRSDYILLSKACTRCFWVRGSFYCHYSHHSSLIMFLEWSHFSFTHLAQGPRELADLQDVVATCSLDWLGISCSHPWTVLIWFLSKKENEHPRGTHCASCFPADHEQHFVTPPRINEEFDIRKPCGHFDSSLFDFQTTSENKVCVCFFHGDRKWLVPSPEGERWKMLRKQKECTACA